MTKARARLWGGACRWPRDVCAAEPRRDEADLGIRKSKRLGRLVSDAGYAFEEKPSHRGGRVAHGAKK